MRACISAWFKTVCAFAILGVMTFLTMAATAPPLPLAARLEQHVRQIASVEHNTATMAALEKAAVYIETTLTADGYRVARQEYTADGHRVRNLEVSIANLLPGKPPDRIFIVGAHYDSARGAPGANDNASGTAAVIELAHMLRAVKPSAGTELKFVFFVNEEPPYFLSDAMGSWQHASDLKTRTQPVEAALILETIGYYSQADGSQRYPPGLARFYPKSGNFIAFVGTLGSSALVRNTLAAFRAASSFPAEGLAAPAFVEGVTLSDHTSYNRHGYPALMITDTAFLRYPYYHTAQDTPDKLDYASMAHVVNGLSRVVEGMVAPKRT